MGSKQAEKEVDVDPDTSAADSGAIAPAERVSYLGTQAGAATPTSAGPSSSSFSSKKRSKPSENAVIMNQLVDAVRDFNQTVCTVINMQGSASAPAPAPAPTPAPAPALLTSAQLEAQVEATRRLFDSTREDNWLSVPNTAAMVRVFQNDVLAANAFLIIAKGGIAKDGIMRHWVLQTLGVEDGNL
jgi:hypothetical protein